MYFLSTRGGGTTENSYIPRDIGFNIGGAASTLTATAVAADKTTANVGETITFTGMTSGGTGTNTKYLFRVYNSSGVQVNTAAWQTSNTFEFTPSAEGTYFCTFRAKDSVTTTSTVRSDTVTVSVA